MTGQPYISVVAVGRNDNYGGDFKSRLQKFMTWNHQRLLESGISAEFIFVNYNPVQTEVAIEDFISWPTATSSMPVRIITVPNEIHKQMLVSGIRKDVPVLEYVAKNAGIRRAKGQFILSMNPDIILPAELVKQLKQLNSGEYYRADRVDYSGEIDGQHELTRVYLKGQHYPISRLTELSKLRRTNAAVNTWRAFTPKIAWLLNAVSSPVYYNNTENKVHCNVSGDFMLMHRDHWHAINGHAEETPISLHVDALTVVQAATLGLKEHVFESPIFHQEHQRRYDAAKENPAFLAAFKFFSSEAKKMMETQTARIYNDEHWGLVNFDLPETNL